MKNNNQLLNQKDLNYLTNQGISEEQIFYQIERFKKGFPNLELIESASLGNGILSFSDYQIREYSDFYDVYMQNPKHKAVKFVPSSGAASRMFKELLSYKKSLKNKEKVLKTQAVKTFFENISDFAFYEDLKKVLPDEKNPNELDILEHLLDEKGLNYANLPKALLKFHKIGEDTRSPIDEHFIEGFEYSKSGDNEINIHFTVSSEHKSKFEQYVKEIRTKYVQLYNVKYNISYSIQSASTNTVAVTPDNAIFRDKTGNIVVRQAGHGALLENINIELADIFFIKNIDNVVPSSNLHNLTKKYKKALAGYLLKIHKEAFEYWKLIVNKEITFGQLKDAETFLEEKLFTKLPDFIKTQKYDIKQKEAYIFEKLNRPFRICGMVKNQGEPGGGPFWVMNQDKSISLQIVEKAQINQQNTKQKEILQKSTHFNPVDLICITKNFIKIPFDLKRYCNDDMGIITRKSINGEEIKALELPGLWNGAMAQWNTIFVEVPLQTFNPVKTVNDLLRKEHNV